MSKSNTLLLFQDYSKLKDNNNYLSILPITNNLKKKIKIKEINFVLPTRKEVLKDYEFCNEIYKNISKKFLKLFNEIHNVNFGQKSFEIIIGYWLKNYIYQSFKIYKQVEFIFLNEIVDEVITSKFTDFNFIKENTKEFAEGHACDLEWYYCFFSKIIHYFKKDIAFNIEIEKDIANEKRGLKKQRKKIYENILYSIQDRLRNSNNAFISHTYLPYFQEKKIELIFRQIPNFYKPINSQSKKHINTELRKKYTSFLNSNEDTDKKNIENFIYLNIFNFLPKSFLENYYNNFKQSQSNIFPKNPKLIFTSSLNFFDEIFKIYAACQMNNNKPIFIGQHGNNYFSRIHNNYMPELNYATKFLSWGYENPKFKNVKGLFNFKTINQNKVRKKRTRKKLIIFLSHLSTVADNLFYYPQEIPKSLQRIKLFLKNLRKDIKDNTILRINDTFFRKTYGLMYFEYVKNFGVEIDHGKLNFEKLLKDAKLCIFNYDSTGFLENSCNNFPSIMNLGNDYLNFINDDFVEKYKDLERNKIAFFNEHSLSNHINDIWKKIDDWWESDNIQNCLKQFNHQFNNQGKDKNLEKIISYLKKDDKKKQSNYNQESR